MNSEKIKAFVLKHKWAVLGGVAGLVAVIIFLIRSRSSSPTSTSKGMTQQQAQKLDQDINNLETKLDTGRTSTVNDRWANASPAGFPQSSPMGPVPPVKGMGSIDLPEEWELSDSTQLEPTWSFVRYTDLFRAMNTTDKFSEVGARLN